MSVKPTNPVINRSHPLARGLVGAWPLSGHIRDISGHGFDLHVRTSTGGTTSSVASVGADYVETEMGTGVELTGTTDSRYLQTSYQPTFSPPFSVAVWFRSTGTQTTYAALISQGHSNPSATGWTIQNGHPTTDCWFNLGSGSGSWTTAKAVSFGVNLSTITGWHHYALTYDDVTARTYLDGELVASKALSDSLATYVFSIGADTYHTSRLVKGQFSDVRLFARALSPESIRDAYQNPWDLYSPAVGTHERYYLPLPRPPIAEKGVAGTTHKNRVNPAHPLARGLVAAYDFEDRGGTTLHDVSGRGNNGTLTNMDPATDWVSSRYGGALDFDGSDDYVRSTPDLSSLADMTVSAWVQVPSGTPGNYGDIVSIQNTAASNGIIAQASQVVGTWRFYAYYSGGALNVTSAKTWQDEEPHLFVCVLRGTTAEIYLDGALAASGTSSGSVSFSSAVVNMGARASLHGSSFFSGRISDARVYNRALSAQEVLATYVSGNDLYSPAVGTQERYYRGNAPIGAIGTGLHAIEAGGIYGAPGINSGLHAIDTGVVTE